MPIDPSRLAERALAYAAPMTSIRGRRVQRLVRREFAASDTVLAAVTASGRPALLALGPGDAAALLVSDGRGPEVAVIDWPGPGTSPTRRRFDLLKDSLPRLGEAAVADSEPSPFAGLTLAEVVDDHERTRWRRLQRAATPVSSTPVSSTSVSSTSVPAR
jgi:hypothetical protein